MKDERIWIELIKPWGEYKVGDVASFSRVKGSRLIKEGIAVKAKALKPTRQKPQVETATVPPADETADATPVTTGKDADLIAAEYAGMKVPALKVLAEKAGIEGFANMKKKDLVAALVAVDATKDSGRIADEYADMEAEELQELAEKAGVEGFADMGKEDLVKALTAVDVNSGDPDASDG